MWSSCFWGDASQQSEKTYETMRRDCNPKTLQDCKQIVATSWQDKTPCVYNVYTKVRWCAWCAAVGGAASCAQGCPERTQNLNHELFRLFSPICVASLIHVKTFPNFPCWCVLFGGQWIEYLWISMNKCSFVLAARLLRAERGKEDAYRICAELGYRTSLYKTFAWAVGFVCARIAKV